MDLTREGLIAEIYRRLSVPSGSSWQTDLETFLGEIADAHAEVVRHAAADRARAEQLERERDELRDLYENQAPDVRDAEDRAMKAETEVTRLTTAYAELVESRDEWKRAALASQQALSEATGKLEYLESAAKEIATAHDETVATAKAEGRAELANRILALHVVGLFTDAGVNLSTCRVCGYTWKTWTRNETHAPDCLIVLAQSPIPAGETK